MAEHGETILGLATRTRVTWRTVRSARNAQLRNAAKARQIAAAIGLGPDGEYLVDPASMLALAPPHPEAAE